VGQELGGGVRRNAREFGNRDRIRVLLDGEPVQDQVQAHAHGPAVGLDSDSRSRAIIRSRISRRRILLAALFGSSGQISIAWVACSWQAGPPLIRAPGGVEPRPAGDHCVYAIAPLFVR